MAEYIDEAEIDRKKKQLEIYRGYSLKRDGIFGKFDGVGNSIPFV
jgi:hypothetical protein